MWFEHDWQFNEEIDLSKYVEVREKYNYINYIYIGKYGTTYAKGLIDEVRIYNKVLSSTEISKNYKHGKGKHGRIHHQHQL